MKGLAHPFAAKAMFIASRTVLQEHREISAIAITYGIFLSGLLFLTWAMA